MEACNGSVDVESYKVMQLENKIQRRTGMTDASGSTTWDYDSRGRMTSETKTVTGAGTYTTAWTYNYADQVATMTYPTGETLNYSYLNQLLPNGMSGTAAYVTETRYDAAGRTKQRNLGNNLITKYIYNGWETDGGRLSQIQTGTSGNATSVQSLLYDYDLVGNILTIQDAKAPGGTQTQTFSYDAINRLSSAAAIGGDVTTTFMELYAYNANGNLASNTGLSLYYTDANHDHAVSSTSSGTDRNWTLSYDANGNMIFGNMSGTNLTYNYNAENQMVSVSSGQTYTYDGDGNLVVMNETGTQTVKTVRIGTYYEERTPYGGTTEKRSYYFLGGARVAMRVNPAITYFHTDHLGSVVATTDSSGGSTSTMLYKPWGETRYPTTTPTTPGYRYTGQLEVPNTGLYFYNARWYSPYLNRFLSPDSIIPNQYDPVSWDRYAYVGNNPVNRTDPSGHASKDLDGPGCSNDACQLGAKIGASIYHFAKDIPTRKVASDMLSPTLSEKIKNGDTSALIQMLIPSHIGGRLQVEGSLDFGIGLSGTIGVNVIYNRNSDELAANVDWAIEPGIGFGEGVSGTGGLLIGWASSSASDVTQGYSGVISGTAAAEGAVSVAVSAPIEEGKGLHVDPYSGQVPATVYVGGGGGAGYAGVGIGPSGSWVNKDFTNFLPWNWFK
jgi:RHS repeat-associated protein